jgi:hypothetical protein
MSFGFKNIGHVFATVAGDIVKGARAVASVMLKAQKAEPEIEALSSLIFPQAVELERGAFALLGLWRHTPCRNRAMQPRPTGSTSCWISS